MDKFFDNLVSGMKRDLALKEAQSYMCNVKIKDLVNLEQQNDLGTLAVKVQINRKNKSKIEHLIQKGYRTLFRTGNIFSSLPLGCLDMSR